MSTKRDLRDPKGKSGVQSGPWGSRGALRAEGGESGALRSPGGFLRGSNGALWGTEGGGSCRQRYYRF